MRLGILLKPGNNPLEFVRRISLEFFNKVKTLRSHNIFTSFRPAVSIPDCYCNFFVGLRIIPVLMHTSEHNPLLLLLLFIFCYYVTACTDAGTIGMCPLIEMVSLN